eukprot:gene32136-biopygen9608
MSQNDALWICQTDLLRCLDSEARGTWRLVCKSACKAVGDNTRCLTWKERGLNEDGTGRMASAQVGTMSPSMGMCLNPSAAAGMMNGLQLGGCGVKLAAPEGTLWTSRQVMGLSCSILMAGFHVGPASWTGFPLKCIACPGTVPQSLTMPNKSMGKDLLSRTFKLFGYFSAGGHAREKVKKAVAPLILDNFQIENVKIMKSKGGNTLSIISRALFMKAKDDERYTFVDGVPFPAPDSDT